MKLFVLACVGLLVVSTGAVETRKTKFTRIMRSFSGKVLNRIVECSGSNTNILYSPLSLYITLGMLRVGSEGSTHSNLTRLLQLERREEYRFNVDNLMKKLYRNSVDFNKDVIFRVANALFPKKGYSINSSFTGTMKDKYFAHVDDIKMDDSGVSRINNWIAQRTENLITNMLSYLDPLTRIVIVNAVYFKATWKHKFLRSTANNRFTLSSGEEVTAKFIEQEQVVFSNYYDYDLEFVAIPYNTSDTDPATSINYLVIGIPREDLMNNTMNYTQILQQFVGNSRELLKRMNISTWRKERIRVVIPEFEIKQEADVSCVLEREGAYSSIFSNEADFSGISSEQLSVSQFRHKAYINVNQQGTEAAAVSVVTFVGRSAGGPSTFLADRPFFYGIYNTRADVFLFMGLMNDPRS